VAPGRRVVLLGFSQGGLMVTQLLRSRPGAFVAGLVLSGFSLAGEQAGDAALAADPPPVLFARGDADAVIAPEASERTSTWLATHSRLVERVYPGMPHTVGEAERADVHAFIEQVLTDG
jgi:phospholipase/carboxylesterase